MMNRLRHWWGLRFLIWQLVGREVRQRYRGSMLGGLWQILTPLLMLTVYTWVFSVVFQAKWGTAAASSGSSQIDFALHVFAGMLFLQLFVETVARAPTLIVHNANYVKKVVFPLPVLPVVTLLSSLFQFGIGVVIWGTFYATVHHTLHWTLLLIPLLLIPFMLLIMGIAWALAATGVYVRDIGPAIQMVLTLLAFVSPVFYPLDALPASMQGWLLLNPLSFVIEQARGLMLAGALPDWGGLALYTVASLGVAIAGLGWFRFTRQGFADVL